MKCLTLFPPQWTPFSPHLAGPAINAALRQVGHDARLHDLNAAFYKQVLRPQFLLDAVKQAFADFDANAAAVFRDCPDEDRLKEYPEGFQRRYRRYREISRMARRNEYRDVIRRIAWAVEVMRDKQAFYVPASADSALSIINKACGILSATHHPSGVYFLRPTVRIYYSVSSLVADCEDVDGNIFRAIYQALIPDLLKDAPDFIGISLGDYSQLLPAMTLAMMLKQATQAHICIGGNLFGRYTDVLIDKPEFFRRFADSVIYNEGEKPVVELLRCLSSGADVATVPNLIHLGADGRIVINDEAPPLPIDQLPAPDFSELPPADYFLPEVIYSIQTSRSCYWRKCSFCTHHAGSRYAVKPVEKMLAEIQGLQASSGARYFHFIDEAISPAYLRRLSRAIIDAGLDIRFYMYGRLERAFTPEVFRLAHRAGLRMVLWGFESASERVYRLMNKGELAATDERRQILEAAYGEGVWNFLFLMFGFPTETLDEAKATVDFARQHRHMISHGTGSSFMLLGDSPILADLPRFSITKVQKVRNGFSFAHRYETDAGMSRDEKQALDTYKTSAWGLQQRQYRDSSFREKLFLYLCQYGTRRVSEMRETMWL